jgi:hypothetical protein
MSLCHLLTICSVFLLIYLAYKISERKVLQTVRIIHGFSTTEKFRGNNIFAGHRRCFIFGLAVAQKQSCTLAGAEYSLWLVH